MSTDSTLHRPHSLATGRADMSAVYLREIERTDLASINRWRADYKLVSKLGANFRHVGPEVDASWFENYLGARSNNVRLAICLCSDHRMIGVVYLLNIDWVNRSAVFSIQIGESNARGLGAGSTATRAMLAHAFDDLNLHRITLEVLADNDLALRLYEQVGFEREGVFRQAVFKHGSFIDVIAMAMLRPTPVQD